MEKQEGLKEQIKKAEIDRRELADAIGITPAYLTQMLNGWAPMKGDYEKAIRVELEKR
jgi:plasmid maintenance system antidote protein VapI